MTFVERQCSFIPQTSDSLISFLQVYWERCLEQSWGNEELSEGGARLEVEGGGWDGQGKGGG